MTPERRSFIAELSRRLGRSEPPVEPPPRPPAPAGIQQGSAGPLRREFMENARLNNTMVRTCTRKNFPAMACEMVAALGQGPIVAARDLFFSATGLYDHLRTAFAQVAVWDPAAPRAKAVKLAEMAAVGISPCEMALAESGTVMVFCHQGNGRCITLLPATTLFVIHEEAIVPRLTQAMASLDHLGRAALPASINLISGASSTADIELVRVQGVHGPVAIGYLIVCPEDAAS